MSDTIDETRPKSDDTAASSADEEVVVTAEIESFSHARELETSVLNALELELRRGEVVGLVGPTGAGKTSLTYCLNGLVPDIIPGRIEGDVRVAGHDPIAESASDLAGTIGSVMENPDTQILGLTVEEDIGLGPSNLGMPAAAIRERISDLLDRMGLRGYETRNPNNLSGGEQQSLAIASILSMEPSVLILDEPVSMLDPRGTQRTFEILGNLIENDPEKSIILTESGPDIEECVGHVSRLVLLGRNGHVAASGSPREVITSEKFVEVGIRRPDVTELCMQLDAETGAIETVPLSVDEAVEQLEPLLRERRAGERTLPDREGVLEHDGGNDGMVASVEDVSFAYDAESVLEGVSLDVYHDEVLGLIGQNGSGKTTLCKLLIGLLEPDNGTVTLDGLDTREEPMHRLMRKANYAYQNHDDQLVKDDVISEVSFGLKQMGLSGSAVRERAVGAMERFGIADIEHEKISMLDTSDKSLVQIASLTALEPDVLILDEPTRGLDHTEITNMFDRLIEFARENGTSLVLVSHHMRYVADYCDRLTVLADGEIHLSGDTRSVFAQRDRLAAADIDPPQVTRLGQQLSEYGVPADVLTVEEMRHLLSREVSD
jgi:energy-coupling factor transport system ATP-binding protein